MGGIARGGWRTLVQAWRQKLTRKARAALVPVGLASVGLLWGRPGLSAAGLPVPPRTVLISEVAWAGTKASPYDEWIELYNPTDQTVDLTGWRLRAADGSPDIALEGAIPPHGYFLLERTDDATVSDIPADQIYTGSLSNAGERLTLLGPQGEVVDTANAGGGPWPAGEASSHATMERIGQRPDGPGAWGTNNGLLTHGHDAHGAPLRGTAKFLNSLNWNTPTPTAAATGTPSPAPTATPTATPPRPFPSATATPRPSPTLRPTPTPAPYRGVIINEVAWAGTRASANDEWIELYNPTRRTLSLEGWHLNAVDGRPTIALHGSIPPHGYFLLERTDDTTISDIPADQIYTGSLSNAGESLYLTDPTGFIVDRVAAKGGWPGGDATRRRSMERLGLGDRWRTFPGYGGCGHDAQGNPIAGTPRCPNAAPQPSPTPRPAVAYVRINEFLPYPRYDWNRDGKADNGDEFIELINLGTQTVDLTGWWLDDGPDGSPPFRLPEKPLRPGRRVVFFAATTGISLSNAGDEVRLLTPEGYLVDRRAYAKADEWNLSWCRLQGGPLVYACWPTPGGRNLPYRIVTPPERRLKHAPGASGPPLPSARKPPHPLGAPFFFRY